MIRDYTAYLDESALVFKADQSPTVYAVGGYIFTPEMCSPFERSWMRTLEIPNPPLKRFHMTDFENREGPYKGWSEDFRRLFLGQLIKAIHTVRPIPFMVAFDSKAFNGLSLDDQSYLINRDKQETLYTFAVSLAIGYATKIVGDDARTAFILDSLPKGQRDKSYLNDQFIYMRDNPEAAERWGGRLHSMSWEKSVDVPQLQAADFCLYELAKLVEGQAGFQYHPRLYRKSAELLFSAPKSERIKPYIYDAESLGKLVNAIRSDGGFGELSAARPLAAARRDR